MVRKRRRVLRRIVSRAQTPIAKLSPYAFGNAIGIVSAIGLFFYAVMVWFGDFSGAIITSQYPIPFSFNSWTILIGLIETYVFSYIGGWIFVKIYNKTIRK
ncbi:MAG: hypothetical protein IIA87_05900 [Nanoarchaeota archaeon]|nr:hypothetical protein [Nanoarchaeota archaeon]